ncbi:MAG TPA: hypothetical protein VF938_02235, partial [Candidatus Angelobacter sp.]
PSEPKPGSAQAATALSFCKMLLMKFLIAVAQTAALRFVEEAEIFRRERSKIGAQTSLQRCLVA